MAYLALYRKWRPQDFESLVGQPAVKTALVNALDSGKIAHAYLFTGPRGTGKTSTARILAKALNCEKGPTSKPCGCCGNCERIAAGSSLDVLEIDAASNRGLDEMKSMREQVAFAPAESRYKIYIVDEVHMLTREASNAFLKTLEEPPAHVIFILATTDPQKVLPTIHSRCQRFDFRRVTVDDITEHLASVAGKSGIEADNDALRLIAINADGGMRDALSLLDQCSVMGCAITDSTVRDVLGIAGSESVRDLLTAIAHHDVPAAIDLLWDLLAQGKNEKQLLVNLAEYFRALLLFKAVPGFEEIYLTDSKENLARLAPLFSEEQIMAAQERVHRAGEDLKNSLRPRIALELCLIDLCREEGNALAELAARVDELEKKLKAGALPRSEAAYAAARPAKAGQGCYTGIPDAPVSEATAPSAQAPAGERPQDAFDAPKKSSAMKNAKSATGFTGTATSSAPEGVSVGQDLPKPRASSSPLDARLDAIWQKTLSAMQADGKNSMVSCAQGTHAYDMNDNVLRIAFPQPFTCGRFNKPDWNSIYLNYFKKVSGLPVTSVVGLSPDEIPQTSSNAHAITGSDAAGELNGPADEKAAAETSAPKHADPKPQQEPKPQDSAEGDSIASTPRVMAAIDPAPGSAERETPEPPGEGLTGAVRDAFAQPASDLSGVPDVLLEAQKILGGTIERISPAEE